MPRQARIRSNSGYLHVIVRGIGRQLLFEEDEDYRFYLNRLERYSRETQVGVCSYCLMENHVHLLLHDHEGNVPLLMKKMGVSYSQYFNKKYNRIGHLFQDRYLSEPIEDEAYFLTALRYILNNPRKAGLCATADYPWSSYDGYDDALTFLDSTLMREMLGSFEQYAAFIGTENEDRCLEYEAVKHDDEWAAKTLKTCLDVPNGLALQGLDRKARNEALNKLKACGLTVRQIERLTGISRNIIQRAK